MSFPENIGHKTGNYGSIQPQTWRNFRPNNQWTLNPTNLPGPKKVAISWDLRLNIHDPSPPNNTGRKHQIMFIVCFLS